MLLDRLLNFPFETFCEGSSGAPAAEDFLLPGTNLSIDFARRRKLNDGRRFGDSAVDSLGSAIEGKRWLDGETV